MNSLQACNGDLESRAAHAEQRAVEADGRRSTAQGSLTAAEGCNSVLTQELQDLQQRLTTAEALCIASSQESEQAVHKTAGMPSLCCKLETSPRRSLPPTHPPFQPPTTHYHGPRQRHQSFFLCKSAPRYTNTQSRHIFMHSLLSLYWFS